MIKFILDLAYGSGSPWRGDFDLPFPFPFGEAIRRHEARRAGIRCAPFRPTPEAGSLRQRQGLLVATLLRSSLTPTTLFIL